MEPAALHALVTNTSTWTTRPAPIATQNKLGKHLSSPPEAPRRRRKCTCSGAIQASKSRPPLHACWAVQFSKTASPIWPPLLSGNQSTPGRGECWSDPRRKTARPYSITRSMERPQSWRLALATGIDPSSGPVELVQQLRASAGQHRVYEAEVHLADCSQPVPTRARTGEFPLSTRPSSTEGATSSFRGGRAPKEARNGHF